MNKTLYDEALADAQKLRELAEETAKNRVIEAIMPQIKQLVDRRIIGEQADDMEDFPAEMIDPEEEALEPAYEAGDAEAEIEGNVIKIDAQGDVNVNMGSDPESSDEDDFVLTDQMAEALARMITGEASYEQTIEEKVNKLATTVKKLRMIKESVGNNISRTKKKRLELAFVHCVKEAMNLRSEIILSEQNTQEGLERKLTETIKEMKTMSKSNRNIFDFLFEAEEDKKKVEELEEAELSLGLDDEEKEELAGAEDVEAVDTALEDILGDLEVAMDLEGEEGAEGEELGMEEEMPEEGGEEGGEELELGGEDLEEVYELDESTLRRELRRMRRLREQEEAVDTWADPDPAEEVGEVFYDVNEDDLINVLADELGPVDEGDAAPVSAPELAQEVRRRRRARARMHERRRRSARGRRTPRRRVSESRRVSTKQRNTINELKKQLVEMNLFNAKLLYANKLMQNKNLSVKQQRAIVEAIDNAKTLREAKLLYKSLSESLVRRARGKKLNEGALRTLGSSSRSTRSAQPKSSGVEVDRWAVLAGLNGKN